MGFCELCIEEDLHDVPATHVVQGPLGPYEACDRHAHAERCCTVHGTHSNPHIGCILR